MERLLLLMALALITSCGESVDETEVDETSGDEESGDETEEYAAPVERLELVEVPEDDCHSKEIRPGLDERSQMAECFSLVYEAESETSCTWKKGWGQCRGTGYSFTFEPDKDSPGEFGMYVIGSIPVADIEPIGDGQYFMHSDVFGRHREGFCTIRDDTAYICRHGVEPEDPSQLEVAVKEQERQAAEGPPNAACRMAAWWYGSIAGAPDSRLMIQECSKLLVPETENMSCKVVNGLNDASVIRCAGRSKEYRVEVDATGKTGLLHVPVTEKPVAVIQLVQADDAAYDYRLAIVGPLLPPGKGAMCRVTRTKIERCIVDDPPR